MPETVKIRLRKPPRVFTFIAKNIEIARNDPCVVRTERGLEYGVCVATPEDASRNELNRYKMPVVRRASHHDTTTYGHIQDDERRALASCRERIRGRNMNMKLVDCEYTFDRKKIIFYFSAEDRVDFRDLVKELAQELKTRIELRHIQVRDEAKMIGGIGSCGRELCCTTWMRDFMPISMKMAKRQNLSLNPAKISGQCGRLMCCLAYENELYGNARHNQSREGRASVRDNMEADRDSAAKAIADTPLTDALKPEDIDETRGDREPQAGSQAQDAPRDEAENAAQETQEQKPAGARRRRGRRGRGGRRGGSGGEGGSDA